jgi:hypothetical protein
MIREIFGNCGHSKFGRNKLDGDVESPNETRCSSSVAHLHGKRKILVRQEFTTETHGGHGDKGPFALNKSNDLYKGGNCQNAGENLNSAQGSNAVFDPLPKPYAYALRWAVFLAAGIAGIVGMLALGQARISPTGYGGFVALIALLAMQALIAYGVLGSL